MVYNCTWATVGDVGIALFAFWTIAALAQSRQWLRQSISLQVGVFVFVGIVVTVVFEFLATGILDRWQYADIMPVISLLGTGDSPIGNWLIAFSTVDYRSASDHFLCQKATYLKVSKVSPEG